MWEWGMGERSWLVVNGVGRNTQAISHQAGKPDVHWVRQVSLTYIKKAADVGRGLGELVN